MSDRTLDRDWVRHRLDLLGTSVASLLQSDASLFAPSEQVYGDLESGGEAEIQQAARDICAYLKLFPAPAVVYEWGLRMELGIAGQISPDDGSGRKIRVPVAYAGRPFAQGAILAHEITHQVLAVRRVGAHDRIENERLTDLASIYLGLGNLVLNGSQTQIVSLAPESECLGYIPYELKVYAYQEVARRFNVPLEESEKSLTAEALVLVRRRPNHH